MTSHKAFFGQSGTGKTTLARYMMETESAANIMFFNTQEEKPPEGFANATRKDYIGQVIKSRVSYVPSADDEQAALELSVIVNHMMQSPAAHVLVVDEAQEYAREGARAGALEKLARRGRRYDCELWVISQHPADMSKKVLRQVGTTYLFDLPWSDQYLRQFHIPAEQLKERINEKGKHAFCVWDGIQLSEAQELTF